MGQVCDCAVIFFFPRFRTEKLLFHRKILKDLSSEDTRDRKGDEESPGVSTVTSMSIPTPIYQTSTGQYSKLHEICA